MQKLLINSNRPTSNNIRNAALIMVPDGLKFYVNYFVEQEISYEKVSECMTNCNSLGMREVQRFNRVSFMSEQILSSDRLFPKERSFRVENVEELQ